MIRILLAGVLTASVAVGPPKTPPPRVGGTEVAPPPAWSEGSGRSRWMAFGSYCWSAAGKAACADMVPPAQRTDIPTLKVRRDAVVTAHLGFTPRTAHVSVAALVTPAKIAGRQIAWRARRTGLVIVETNAAGGSASYLIRMLVGS